MDLTAGVRQRRERNDKAGDGPKGSGGAASKPGLQTRQAAARLLAAVVDRRTSLDGMLDPQGGNPAFLALGEADRALARAIVMTALRHRRTIDEMIGKLLDRPLPDGARSLHFSLAVAAAQILYLDVPDRAAVDLAVEQAHADPRNRRFASLANAVLRRLAREKDALLAATSGMSRMPEWFDRRLAATFGAKRADAITAMLAEPPSIDLTVKSDPEGWADRLGGIVLPTGSVRLVDPEGPVPALPGFDDGEWWVQDAAAAIPARLFGDLAGRRVVDLCAAPGGKTAQLALAGASVTALDRSASRLERLRENLARLSLDADCVEADLLAYEPTERFDGVLLDAPCSSTGTTRRHPDVPWTKGLEDIERLAVLQEKMLRHALRLTKPGGLVVFSNCSVDPREGEEVVARVLAETPGVTLHPVSQDALPGLEEALTETGCVRTTPEMLPMDPPCQGGLDGFFAAVFRVDA